MPRDKTITNAKIIQFMTEEFLEYEEEEMIVVEETTGFYEEEKADGPLCIF